MLPWSTSTNRGTACSFIRSVATPRRSIAANFSASARAVSKTATRAVGGEHVPHNNVFRDARALDVRCRRGGRAPCVILGGRLGWMGGTAGARWRGPFGAYGIEPRRGGITHRNGEVLRGTVTTSRASYQPWRTILSWMRPVLPPYPSPSASASSATQL